MEVGVLAGLGREKVTVYRRPEASVITTGDELLLPGEPAAPGKIYDSNLYTLVTRLESLGVSVTDKGRVEDEAATVAKRLAAAAKQADILITTGGVSVGKKDIMHEVIQILGCERLFWKIAIKPGMPNVVRTIWRETASVSFGKSLRRGSESRNCWCGRFLPD